MSHIPPNPNKGKKNKNYFTEETEQAIVAYLASDDQIYRDKLFKDKIWYGIYKLAENLIHTDRFYYMDVDTVEELKHEVMTFFIEKFHMYKPESGKAYSYFTRAGFNYLIAYNNENYKKLKNKKELENVDEERNLMKEIQREDFIGNTSAFFPKYITYMDVHIDKLFKDELDQKIAYAVLEIFKRVDNIEIFNKKALYIMIKEQVPEINDKTTILTNVLKVMKKKYLNLFKFYEKTGKVLV